LYALLDNLYFSENGLYDLADWFSKKGGQLLVLDEVHRYPNRAVELKNIYDDFSFLKVIFTASSLLQLSKAKADLSRRVVMYSMPGLSFREFLLFETGDKFPILKPDDILRHHVGYAADIIAKIKPLAWFEPYLNYDYLL